MKRIKNIALLFIDAGRAWAEDRVALYAAAIAYYTVFSLAPTLALSIAVAGFFLGGRFDVQAQVVIQVEQFLGTEAADLIRSLLNSIVEGASSATIISLLLLFYAASGVFNQLKAALDLIFGVIPKPQPGIKGALTVLRTRVLAFAMVLFVGFLLLVAVLLNAAASFLAGLIAERLPAIAPAVPSVSFLISPIIMLFLFSLTFKSLPHARLRWRDVMVGAAVTTLLFMLGISLISLYLRFSSLTSLYAAAGSLIVILLWIYYSAQIVLYGAEFTKVYANRLGRPIQPEEDAMFLSARLMERREEAMALAEAEVAARETAAAQEPVARPRPAVVVREPEQHEGQARKQVAAGLLGLALGLFLSYVSHLFGEE